MKPRVYVCGASYEAERARAVIDSLREFGAEVSHDWTTHVIDARAHGGDAKLNALDRWRATVDDLAGVDRAHAILWLVPERGSTGSGFEVGYAFARGIPIIASGPHVLATIFSSAAVTSTPDDALGVEVAIRAALRVLTGQERAEAKTSKVRRIGEDA